MQNVFLITLFILGACLGSFVCCQVRRLHFRIAKPKSKKTLGPRSVCLSCHHQLKWYDNIPIISWLLLRGKCRYCHHKIGCAEVLSEIGLSLGFLVLGSTINVENAPLLVLVNFVVILFFTLTIWFLAIYDGIYGELPVVILYSSIFIAVIHLIIQEVIMLSAGPFTTANITNPVLSVLILGGLYLFLYLISKGKWVGDGDWLLATAIGIVLFYPWLAINALFFANLIACVVMLPLMRNKKTHHIHLGPFLVVGFLIIYSTSNLFLSLIGA